MVAPITLFAAVMALASPALGLPQQSGTNAQSATNAPAPSTTDGSGPAGNDSPVDAAAQDPATAAKLMPPPQALTAPKFGAPRTIHAAKDWGKCLDVRGANFADFTPVQIFDCNGTGAQKWVLNPGYTYVRVYGTDYCLEAGYNARDGSGTIIRKCDGSVKQVWYNRNNRLRNFDGDKQCLDLTDGNTNNWNQAQTWTCYPNNNNQVWFLDY